MTTAPGLDERQHLEAIKAALTAQLGADRVFEYGQVPGQAGAQGTIPPIFVLPAIERRFVTPDRHGRSGRTGWRLSTRFTGSTPDEARWASLRVSRALDGARLAVGSSLSTPLTFESSTSISPDDGRHSGESFWTYAL